MTRKRAQTVAELRHRVVFTRILDRVFEQMRKSPGETVKLRDLIKRTDVDAIFPNGIRADIDGQEVTSQEEAVDQLMAAFVQKYRLNSGDLVDLS
jgi:hypothetical protein